MTDHAILLTEDEAAARMRVCAKTLRKARQAGQLHYILIGRAVRYTVADLESYVEQLRQVTPACAPAPPTRRTSIQRRAGERVIIPFTERNAGR